MRHRKIRGRLNRRTSWRKATLKAMANDLLVFQRIRTTLAKAKALRRYVEPIITIAKKDPGSVLARRRVFAELCDRKAVTVLFNDLAPLFKDVPGGYSRIMTMGYRRGDGAELAIIELTKRTISDDDLLGVAETKEKTPKKTKKTAKGKAAAEKKKEAGSMDEANKAHHVAPDVPKDKQEERTVEDIKKERAKTEKKKITQHGLFKRFRRKSI
ncbi:MAG: 50S ribosomal protein L17 [Candidatus Omnitrophica bacterium]|jgi:large subunit ribosomal protein L17|nr:50S ribosomal protein L17 [Candidatus Omnitrophota bacterium]MDD4012839.1 50S ribosomal protein L17 [Candidatus Omnitrophota bacterium]